MFKKLQDHWGVNGWRFFLIMCTFAVTGTFTAWVSKEITGWFDAEKYSLFWWSLKIFVLLIGYQVFILIFGFCFGQFSFFWKFEKKLLTRLGLMKKDGPVNVAIFASGAGSNAHKIIKAFADPKSGVHIALIVCNREGAGVLDIAKNYGIETLLIGRKTDNNVLISTLKKKQVSMIILAGYLWKLAPEFIKAFSGKIINIHPALLPKYGGKGMYGKHVHEAVLANNEKESGITIHYVDEIYDNGEIIFQEKCMIEPSDNAATLAEKIHALEHRHYSEVIKKLIQKQNRS